MCRLAVAASVAKASLQTARCLTGLDAVNITSVTDAIRYDAWRETGHNLV